MTTAAAAAAAALCLAALPAGAASPAEGRATAAAEAGLRAEGAELVEIEGFAGPEGDIPCKGKSFSNAWHYKYYVPGGEWLIVNACGDTFINAAKHFPYMKSAEPDKKLPYTLAAPAEVLKRLKDDGLFTPEPNPFSRDVQMTARMLPAKDGRPEGCYWTVAQGKAKFLTDCEAKQSWRLGKGQPKAAAQGEAAAGTGGQGARGKDTAGRYATQAVDTMRKKTPDAQLMYIEALADRTGSAKCVDPRDGWTFAFSSRASGISSFGACRGKTTVEYMTFDGKLPVDKNKMNPIVLPFKDSDFALSQVARECGGSTISMKLANYKPGVTPVTGHTQVWTIDCGSRRFYVDSQTGKQVKLGAK